ncbi:AMP-binding protein [Sneathiella sp. P13V-1]|uniref:AMP-binding protein n=1 Tax=Sneathiella sp. P13V-1 TaxID=2697366 RepID=UPI00187BA985|nr:AMP-binding protein [Sneathiella sp. P13V-1]MBE7638429.1 AMP-binding protein [Sneathiella sp. P13V-1]
MEKQQAGKIWSQLKTLFQERHSVRAFLNKPVPENLLAEIFENAARSPSGGNLQPWQVYAVSGALKDRLGAAIQQAYWDKGHTSPDEYSYYPETWVEPYITRRSEAAQQLFGALGLGARDVKEKRVQQAKNYDFFGAPVGLIFVMDRDLSQGSWLDMGMYINSVSMLANAAGLGTCLQASFISYPEVIRQVLEIPEDQIILCGMAIGYEDTSQAVNDFKTDRKSIFETVVEKNSSLQDLGARFLGNGHIFKNRTALKIGETSVSWAEFAKKIDEQASLISSKYAGKNELPLLLGNSLDFAVLFTAGQVAGKNVQVLDPAWPQNWIDDVATGSRICTELLPTNQSDRKTHNDSIDVEQPFYTGFTSGSTGRPKGFVRSQKSWLESFEIDRVEFGMTPHDIVASIGNFSHSLPLYAMVRALYEGATSICFPSFHPAKVLQELEAEQVTILYAVPTQLDALCRAASGQENLEHVKWVLSSGAKCSEELYRKLRQLFPNAELAEFYGSSELSFISVAKKNENIPDASVGRVLPMVNLQIRDANDKVCPAGEIGRVHVQSPLQFLGYLGHSFINREDGLYTGDTGYVDETGCLYLTGRFDRMLNVKGRNIFPEMIEQCLIKMKGVASAAVFGIDDPKRGQDIVAVVETTSEITFKEVREACRQYLPDYALPRRVYRTDAWPMTSSGKTNFPLLKSQLSAGELERLI